MEYRHVDCPGKVLHNVDIAISPRSNDKNWEGKVSFLENYKFTIAFENDISPDYVTEKLIHPFLAHSIPIYLGGTNLDSFNPKSFINVANFDSFDEAIKRIIELDQDDEQYLSMLNEYPFCQDFDRNQLERLKNFIFKIIDQGNIPFTKDPLHMGDTSVLYQLVSKSLTPRKNHFFRDLSRRIRGKYSQ